MNKMTISGTAKLLNYFLVLSKTSPPQELSYSDITKLTRADPNLFDHFLVSLSFPITTITIFCSFVEKVDQIASKWEEEFRSCPKEDFPNLRNTGIGHWP